MWKSKVVSKYGYHDSGKVSRKIIGRFNPASISPAVPFKAEYTTLKNCVSIIELSGLHNGFFVHMKHILQIYNNNDIKNNYLFKWEEINNLMLTCSGSCFPISVTESAFVSEASSLHREHRDLLRCRYDTDILQNYNCGNFLSKLIFLFFSVDTRF